jgi:hypothetical protein
VGQGLPAKPAYANDAGVKLSTVIGDAARECGETLGAIPTGTAGPHFVRAEGPAVRVLHELAERAWYVDEAGVTQFGRRPKVTYSGGATRVTPVDLSRGTVDLAPTTIADLLPGVVIDGLEAVDVEHTSTRSCGPPSTAKGSRTRRGSPAFERIVETFTASHRYFAPWEYRVVQRVGERLELQIARASSGMPDQRNVRMRTGVAGCSAYPKLGSLVLVSFVNGDPGRPVVTAFDDPESPGFVADDIFLQAGGSGREDRARDERRGVGALRLRGAARHGAGVPRSAWARPPSHRAPSRRRWPSTRPRRSMVTVDAAALCRWARRRPPSPPRSQQRPRTRPGTRPRSAGRT